MKHTCPHCGGEFAEAVLSEKGSTVLPNVPPGGSGGGYGEEASRDPDRNESSDKQETPRVNAVVPFWQRNEIIDLARQLERELAEATDRLAGAERHVAVLEGAREARENEDLSAKLPSEPTHDMLEAMVRATWDMDHSDLKWSDAMKIARKAYHAMLPYVKVSSSDA